MYFINAITQTVDGTNKNLYKSFYITNILNYNNIVYVTHTAWTGNAQQSVNACGCSNGDNFRRVRIDADTRQQNHRKASASYARERRHERRVSPGVSRRPHAISRLPQSTKGGTVQRRWRRRTWAEIRRRVEVVHVFVDEGIKTIAETTAARSTHQIRSTEAPIGTAFDQAASTRSVRWSSGPSSGRRPDGGERVLYWLHQHLWVVVNAATRTWSVLVGAQRDANAVGRRLALALQADGAVAPAGVQRASKSMGRVSPNAAGRNAKVRDAKCAGLWL